MNTVIVPIRDDVLPYAIDSNPSKAVELPIPGSVRSKLVQKVASLVKDLDAVIGRVGDDDSVVRADGDAPRPRKVSGLAPPTPYLEQLAALLQVLAPRGGTCCDTGRRRTRRVGGAWRVF